MLLVGLALAACGGAPSAPVVVGRVGEAPEVPTEPRLDVMDVLLGESSRRALRLAQGRAFEVRLPAAVERIEFSAGVPRARERAPDVRFRVLARQGGDADGSWQILFDEHISSPAARWHDRVIEVARAAPGARRFRFETTPLPGAAVPVVLWGSIVFRGPPGAPPAPPPRARPNVVLISLDTLAAPYLGFYGNPAQVSPNLDALLSESFAFRRAFAQYGNTLVSHSSLFSGLYPIHHGRYPFRRERWPPLRTLVRSLAADGYATIAFTENAYVSSALGFAAGFDRYHEGETRRGEGIAHGDAVDTFAKATEWLQASGRDGPFFLFVHSYEVHEPYLLESDAARRLANAITPGDEREFPGQESTRMVAEHNRGRRQLSAPDIARLKALHFGEIHYLDQLMPRLFEALDALELGARTLVVVTSDHGDQFGEYQKMGHGKSLHGSVLHVPMAFRWPGVIPPGASDAVVQLVDLMPTLLDLMGLPVPDGLDGRSLAPILRGEAEELPALPAFSEMRRGLPGCGSPSEDPACLLEQFAVHEERFKLIRSRDGEVARLVEPASDPVEVRDLTARHPQEAARLSELLDAYLASEAPSHTPSEPLDEHVDEQLRERLRALGYADGSDSRPTR
jgi:arylsulfatase A-like enzyme